MRGIRAHSEIGEIKEQILLLNSLNSLSKSQLNRAVGLEAAYNRAVRFGPAVRRMPNEGPRQLDDLTAAWRQALDLYTIQRRTVPARHLRDRLAATATASAATPTSAPSPDSCRSTC